MCADICKCSGDGCKLKQECYRFRCKADRQQSYFMVAPIKDDGTCDHYMSIEGWNLKDDDGK